MNLKPTKNIIPEMRIPGARAVKGVVLEISIPNKIELIGEDTIKLNSKTDRICDRCFKSASSWTDART